MDDNKSKGKDCFLGKRSTGQYGGRSSSTYQTSYSKQETLPELLRKVPTVTPHFPSSSPLLQCPHPPIPSIPTAQETPVGRRLSQYVSQWSVLTNCPWTLEVVRGYRLEFRHPPSRRPPPHPAQLTPQQEEALDQEIQSLLNKRAISRCTRWGGFFSSVFVVPKKDGGWHPVINLKALNQSLHIQHFKKEGINSVRDALKEGDWLGKIDLRDAYLTVPIHPDHWKYLRFLWKGQAYQCTALPFGLATAPRVFTKIMHSVMTKLREQGIRIIQYLDDILIMADQPHILREHMTVVSELLTSLGFILNLKKCIMEPSQHLEFLGFIMDSWSMTISLPTSKRVKIGKECRRIRKAERVSARELAHLIGMLTAAIPAILPAALHYRALQGNKHRALKGRARYETTLNLDQEALMDLDWWVHKAHLHNGRPIRAPKADLIIESDASKKGWGAFCQSQPTGGPWDTAEMTLHINILELKAAFLAMKTFASHRTHSHILLLIDNRTAIVFINRMGGTHSRTLSNLACEMWQWCLERNLTVHAEHIPGSSNVRADRESRTPATGN